MAPAPLKESPPFNPLTCKVSCVGEKVQEHERGKEEKRGKEETKGGEVSQTVETKGKANVSERGWDCPFWAVSCLWLAESFCILVAVILSLCPKHLVLLT